MKSTLILYPHQLFALTHLPAVDNVVLVEDPLLFGVDQEFRQRLHKQKLILMRASMRRYAQEILWPAGLKVDYIELVVLLQTTDLLEKVRKYDRVFMFDPSHEIITNRLLQARREMGEHAPAIEFLPSPNFYLKEQEARQYFAERHVHPFAEFYQWQRERFNILIENYKPVGGEWMISAKQAKKGEQLPTFGVFGDNEWVQEATKFVSKHFTENPGSTDFTWPTNHEEAKKWLTDFVNHRLDEYGPHTELFDSDAPWLYRSILSSSLNIGLLDPQEVINAALHRHAQRPVPLESLEPFIRQILGHREYIRGISLVGGAPIRSANPLKATRRMTLAWYQGTTGIPVFDDMVKHVLAKGYASHPERLLVAGNLMTMCEIAPADIYQWFNELFVDAHEWALVPHVYSLSQFADNATFEGGPFICPSKSLIEKSNHNPGEWTNIWDGLYWRYVEKHQNILRKNPKMKSVLQKLEQLDPDQKRIISYRAVSLMNSTVIQRYVKNVFFIGFE